MENLPTAYIETLLLAESEDDFFSSPKSELGFSFDGIVGDKRHGGRAMLADVRAKFYRKKRDEVLNRQQVSLIDVESLDRIADELDIDPEVIREAYSNERRVFIAQCMGANIVLNGFHGNGHISNLRELPNATDFGVFDAEAGKFKSDSATLMITRYNAPCVHPGLKLQEYYPNASENMASEFVRVAQNNELVHRGYVAMVAKGGKLRVGEQITFCPLPTSRKC